MLFRSLFQERAFGEEIKTRPKKAALEAIRIASRAKTSSSIKEIKSSLSLPNKETKIEDFFKGIVVDAYKDPLTIKSTESIQRLKRLRKAIQYLNKELKFYLQQASHCDTIQLKKEFQWYSKNLSPSNPVTLQTVDEAISPLEIICDKLIETPGRSGKRNPAFFETVYDLASIWKKYTGKEPTRINYADYRNGPTHSAFLTYIEVSIKSIIPTRVSLLNIAKEIIHLRSIPSYR